MNLLIIKRDINSDVLITEPFFYKIMPLIYIYVKNTKFKIQNSRLKIAEMRRGKTK